MRGLAPAETMALHGWIMLGAVVVLAPVIVALFAWWDNRRHRVDVRPRDSYPPRVEPHFERVRVPLHEIAQEDPFAGMTVRKLPPTGAVTEPVAGRGRHRKEVAA